VRVDGRTLKTKGGLVHEFDAAGRLAAVRWSSAPYPRLEYRSALVAGASRVIELHQWTSASDSLRLASFGYDGAGRLVRIEDRTGRRAELAYDAEGNLVAARDGLDAERGWPGFRYAYQGGALVSVTSSENVRAEPYSGAVRRGAACEGDPRIARGAARGSVTTNDGCPRNVTGFSWDGAVALLAELTGERTCWTLTACVR
jgi:YD repeat-containing protein